MKQTTPVEKLEQNLDLLRNRLNKESRNTLITTIIIHKRELAETQVLLQNLREEINALSGAKKEEKSSSDVSASENEQKND